MALSEDDSLLFSRLDDAVDAVGRKRTILLGFLDERQRTVAAGYLKKQPVQAVFFGGYDGAQRTMLAVFSHEIKMADLGSFPISPVTFRFRKQDHLTHRDFLGVIMSRKVKREAVGDILAGEGICVVFVKTEFASMLAEEITKVGSVGVVASIGAPEVLPPAFSLMGMGGTVSSLRFDCIVALLTHLSREKASQLITDGLCQINHQQCCRVTREIQQGDVISIRSYGKFLLEEIEGVTKKGRLKVLIQKYV